MKTTMRWIGLSLLCCLTAIIFFTCSKERSLSPSRGQQHVSIYLTDDPGLFDHVFVDIQSVSVLVDTCAQMGSHDEDDDHDGDHDEDDDHDGDHHAGDSCNVWKPLVINPGVYDLLTLTNGNDTLLASGNIPAGRIEKIKITLGTNNSLVKDSTTYPLNLFPGQNTITIKLRGDEFDQYLAGHLRVWLDFDVARSIVVVNNNQFFLRPFMRLFVISNTGSIEGQVGPRAAFAVVSVFNSTDTAYAIPNRDEGQFKVRGLKPGTYSVFFNGSNGYRDTTINNINVTAGHETELGRITLRQ